MEDLQRYVLDVVRPTVQDFEKHPDSVRHAFLACVALFHSVDYLAYPKKSRGIRQEFRRRSEAFRVVDMIAHAFKHVHSIGKQGRLLATDVIRRPPAKWGEAAWDVSIFDDEIGGVTLQNELGVDVLIVVREALKFVDDMAFPNGG